MRSYKYRKVLVLNLLVPTFVILDKIRLDFYYFILYSVQLKAVICGIK